ncbi:MAG: hypothetical protein JWL59_3891 [Chthoniobacteraceae bacterium]|nr:hypothetical protein [Chthoniobacteraceae bacterium]
MLSFNDAIEIARHEIERRGLASTHHAAALYAGEDKHTEGAAFAVIIRPRMDAPAKLKRTAASKLKLLIQEDGRTSLQRIKSRISRRTTQAA